MTVPGRPSTAGNDGIRSRAALDISANRAARKWTRGELTKRLLWEALRGPLFGWTPRPLWAWRRSVLRAFGATVGRDVHVHPTAEIAVPWTLSLGDHAAVGHRAILYSLGPITIGARATVSQYAHLCAGDHDFTRRDMPLLKPPIIVGDDAWICADAFVGPGITIGAGAIVGARAVVTRPVPARAIVAGNPARPLRTRPEFEP